MHFTSAVVQNSYAGSPGDSDEIGGQNLSLSDISLENLTISTSSDSEFESHSTASNHSNRDGSMYGRRTSTLPGVVTRKSRANLSKVLNQTLIFFHFSPKTTKVSNVLSCYNC